jgi:Uma2 family endonuclease
MVDPRSSRISLAEYMKIDAGSAEPLEFLDGFPVAQAVPSGAHEQITVNLAAILAGPVKAAGCRLFIGGVKVACPNGDRAIPDFGVTCDERDLRVLESGAEALIEHPWFVGEILSPTTSEHDRGTKLDAYRSIPELTHYLLIDSRKQWMLLHERTPDGLIAIVGPLDRFTIPQLGTLTLENVYDGTIVPRVSGL